MSLALQADSLPAELPGKHLKTFTYVYIFLMQILHIIICVYIYILLILHYLLKGNDQIISL